MLFGRATECGQIDALLEGARGGRSGVLVIRGDAGIGKSALLQHAVGEAGGMRVLSARGIESEAELPFAALHELLGPALDRLDRVPRPQAEALAGALALGPPVPGDRFAVAAGTLSLLGVLAEETPLMLAVDDAHWLDRPSAEALVFAARRLQAERVAAFFSVRAGEPSALDETGLPTITLHGLDPQAARQLLDAQAGDIAPSVAARLVEETEGNPLALAEIPAELSAGQLAGSQPLPELLPAGAGIVRVFSRRVRGLPVNSAQALLVAAASDSAELSAIREAISAAGLDPTALEAAERAGLIGTIGGRLEWRHPLVRSAAYHGASASQRRAVHRASARASTGRDRRAWHLAAAAEGPDEQVARLLEEVALDARRRRGHAAAAAAFERAGRLTADAGPRARRLFEAAAELWLIGQLERARALLDEAAVSVADPVLEAGILHLRGSIEMWAGDRSNAHALLLDAADRLERLDPPRAAAVLVDAALAHQMAGDILAMLGTVRRAEALVKRTGADGQIDLAPLLLNSRILSGEARAVYPELRRRVRAYLQRGDEAGRDVHFPVWAGHVLTWLDEYDDARRLFEREVEAARRNGSLGLVPFSLACLAEADFRLGRWQTAYAGASEAARLAQETAQLNLLSFCLVTLARVEATTGSETECRDHVRQALELADRLGIGSIRVYGLSVLGVLDLGLRRVHEAAATLERLSALVDRLGLREPGVVQWRPDLVEAYTLAGRPDDARRELAVLDEEAERTDRLWARAAAERCRGMLAGDDPEAAFERALELHERLTAPFEQARTQLRLGERLRRARRAAPAREPLRAALETFESLGAAPWAAQARSELAATGARVPGRTEPDLGGLTPQEQRIALLVAEGATNREAAAVLFLSPKTVGYHLGRVYEKLGIHSRSQLAALAARAESRSSGP